MSLQTIDSGMFYVRQVAFAAYSHAWTNGHIVPTSPGSWRSLDTAPHFFMQVFLDRKPSEPVTLCNSFRIVGGSASSLCCRLLFSRGIDFFSGSYAVFTEQGSSASQMTAAKVMDIVSRLPGCAGQAADAVSAYTQVKMEDAPKLLKNSQIGMSRHLDSSTPTQMA